MLKDVKSTARLSSALVPVLFASVSIGTGADSKRNLIFVPQVAPVAVVGSGGDVTTVGAGICGGNSGCVAVYKHDVVVDDQDDDH